MTAFLPFIHVETINVLQISLKFFINKNLLETFKIQKSNYVDGRNVTFSFAQNIIRKYPCASLALNILQYIAHDFCLRRFRDFILVRIENK